MLQDSDDEIPVGDVEPRKDIHELLGYSPIKEKPQMPPPPPQKTEESCIEVRRLKDIGVSFINKEDLYPRKEQSKEGNWYPEATDPFRNDEPLKATATSTSAYSLMINTAALKYMDDPQLTYLAARSPMQQQKKPETLEQSNVSRFGLQEHQVSQATRDYLTNNKFQHY